MADMDALLPIIKKHNLTWSNLTISKNSQIKLPADANFSDKIKNLGYIAAWSENYQVINWGHYKRIWDLMPNYFRNNWQTKSEFQIDGIEKESNGIFILQQENAALKSQLKSFQKNSIPTNAQRAKEKTCLYIDSGSGYLQNNIIQGWLDPNEVNFLLNFKFGIPQNVLNLRWDPIEGQFCEVKIESLKIRDKHGDIISLTTTDINTNCNNRDINGYVIFDTTDPMFFIPFNGELSEVVIAGVWRIID
jgi:hypothetical protein